MNLIDEIKMFFAAKKAADSLKSVSKLDFLDPAHIAMLLTIGATLYKGTLGVAPPQWSLALGVALALGFLLYSLILKLHHQSAAPIAGIPGIDVNAIIAAIEAKYPNLKQYEAPAKSLLESMSTDKATAPTPGSIQ